MEELRQEADNSGGYLVSATSLQIPVRHIHSSSQLSPGRPAKRPSSVEEAPAIPCFAW